LPHLEEAAITVSGGFPRRLRRLLIAVLLVAACICVWDEVFKYRFVAKRFGTVVPGLVFRSGQISRWVIGDVLDRHGIEVVVDLQAADIADEHQRAEIRAAERRGVELARFPLAGDGTGEIELYADAVAVLSHCARRGRPVLVHCGAGAKRTGGVVALYRVLIEGRPAHEAYRELQDYGWHDDNPTLVRFLNSHMEELAELLVERGALPEVPDRLPMIAPAGNENRRRAPELADDAGLVGLR
jgi:protein-tyrosine phosphatase